MKKPSRRHPALVGLLISALLHLTPCARAYLAGSPPKPGDRLASPQVPPGPLRQASASQHSAAALAASLGFQIEWAGNWGTPTLIRGKDFGQARALRGGRGLTLTASTRYEANALAVLDLLAPLYGFRDAEREFKVERTDTDSLGFHHVRLSQRHEGLPVFGGELLVHFNPRDEVYQVNGDYVPEIQLDLPPAFTPETAERLARRELGPAMADTAKLESSPALKILARAPEPRLAYEIVLTTSPGAAVPERWHCWIDAKSGNVLLKFDDIQRIAPPTSNGAPVPITGNRLQGEGGEIVTLDGWFEQTGSYYLRSTNLHWLVYNAATVGYADASTYAHRHTNVWGATDRVEMSLARNFELTQRYFLEVLGRHSFDDAGIQARANAHVGANYVNAFWNGTDFHFGDGDGRQANSLAVLDICAHEYTHAVTESTAHLTYAYESGALNESFSDIFGTCVEFYAQGDGRGLYPDRSPGTADWLCGEDCWRSSVALRDLRAPASAATVGAGNEQPSRHRGTYWYDGAGDNGGVHYNSGVQNFFFYLLCEGGQGTNDGIEYAVTGIGVTNAERVAYRALTVYCTPNMTYQTVRGAWVSAALDLDPAWAAAVGSAWSAVGVNALQLTSPSALNFRGPVGGPFKPLALTGTLWNRSPSPMNWSLVSTQSWLTITPESGSLPPGSGATLNLQLEPSANAMPAGVHRHAFTWTNDVDPGSQSVEARLLVAQPDYFTELFEAGDNDLSYQTWTFTPDEETGSYSVCRAPATGFPTSTALANVVALGDDAFATVTLSGQNSVAIYQRRTNVVFIGSNGYLTVGAGDRSYLESMDAHFKYPRVAGCFDDLDPMLGGTITWEELSDRLVVTFSNVREFGMGATVSFQMELFFSGVIRLTCLGIGVKDGLAGLSPGSGTPANFWPSDLTSYDGCAPPDALQIAPGTGWAAQGYAGGTFTPAQTNYTLSNQGTNALAWSAHATASWLALNPAAGFLDPGASTGVVVSLTAAVQQLGEGVHAATTRFSNLVSSIGQSRSARITATAPVPPTITSEPLGVIVRPGTNVTFCIGASGTTPLCIQWMRNGVALTNGNRVTGAATNCLHIANVTESDSGDYRARVTSPYGTTTSATATLLVSALSHFSWSTIASPQPVGMPIAVSITARDAFQGVATNFNGAVSLSGWMSGVPALLFSRDFEDGNLTGWIESGDYASAVTQEFAAGGHASLSLSGGSGNHFDGLSHELPDLAPTRLDYYVRASSTNQAGGYLVAGGGVSSFACYAYFDQDGTMDFGGVAATNRPAYQSNRWYKVSFLFDWPQRRLTYLRDDQIIQSNVPFFDPSISSLSVLYLYNYDYTRVWWDEIRLLGGQTQVPLSIAPNTSGAFSSGVWAGTIRVLHPATNAVLTARDISGHGGNSTTFTASLYNDLAVELTTKPAQTVVYGACTNVITIRNSGPAPAAGVSATNYLPPSASLLSASASQGSWTLTGDRVEFSVGNLPASATATLTVVTVPEAAGSFTNLVVAGQAAPDTYPPNNSATSVATVMVPVIEVTDSWVVEGNTGTTSLWFNVRLSPAMPYTQPLAYATSDGTAVAGSDYASTNGTLVFLPGQTNQVILVRVLSDATAEADESLSLTFTCPPPAQLGRSVAAGTILSDDLEPFHDDFEPVATSGQWSAFGGGTGGVLATNHGGAVSGVNSLWFGGTGPRHAVTRALDIRSGGRLDFWIRLADSASEVWEDVELPARGIAVEYSTNQGAAWTELLRCDAPEHKAWTHSTVSLPMPACTPHTQIRWRQLTHGGIGFDHWALDAVSIGQPCPRLTAGAATVVSEGCQPPNGVVDPAEAVTLSLSLTNVGDLAATGVVARLLASAGIVPLGGPVSLGSIPPGATVTLELSLVTAGPCGARLPARLQLEAAGRELALLTYPLRLGNPLTVFSEYFDVLPSPALPLGWDSVLSGAGSPWTLVNTHSGTFPSSVFAPDPEDTCENSLISPSFSVPATGAQLAFQQAYSTESCCDGGRLFIAIAGGPFVEFLSAGGSFVANGYQPGAGWFGASPGFPSFITTIADLPGSAWGQTIQLRWQFTADYRVPGVGWYVDSVAVTGGYQCCAGCPVLLPLRLGADEVLLQFATAVGQAYIVQYQDDLADEVWTDLAAVAGNGSVVTVRDARANATSRFYRLRFP